MQGYFAASSSQSTRGRIVVGAYAWLYAVSLGAVVLDVVYARDLVARLDVASMSGIFSEISDLLLFLQGVLLPTGVIALAVAWPTRAVRNLVAISLVAPILALPLAAIFAAVLDAASLGSAVRLLTSLLGAVLSLAGAFWFSAGKTH